LYLLAGFFNMVMVCSGEKCSGDPAAPKENGPLLVQTGR
jgi:hypothetical protein